MSSVRFPGSLPGHRTSLLLGFKGSYHPISVA
ncbi:hypothetical protein LEMLEM_LOCUS9647 [Lemmus lemmus]